MGRIFVLLLILGLFALLGLFDRVKPLPWSDQEKAQIRTLVLPDRMELQKRIVRTGNAYWNDSQALELGKALFFDRRLSINGEVSCATCHQPDKAFTDGKILAEGVGIARRHTPTLIGSALIPWFFWDGRADSLWAQALGPLEDPAEHGTDRFAVARIIAEHYPAEYEAIYGPLPGSLKRDGKAEPNQINRIFANVGKSLAAFQSTLLPEPSRFDRFAKELLDTGESDLLTRTEQQGLKLFLDDKKGQCLRCHNGPLFTNSDFVVTGIRDSNIPVGLGRLAGIRKVLDSPFNCLGLFSDTPNQCDELIFTKKQGPELTYAFKVPTLRQISKTAPYMHNGSFETLNDVLHFYNLAKPQYDQAEIGEKAHLDIEPLGLASGELARIEAFLRTLEAD